MKHQLLASALLSALPVMVLADAPAPPKEGWSGSGEAGLAIASGNAKSENLNAKLDLKFNDSHWKDDFYLTALRNKSEVKTVTTDISLNSPGTVTTSSFNLTSSRYEAGASTGYKFDDRSYVVGALRYDHDQFAPYDYQYTASIGYGYQVLKNASDELSFEAGPGYNVVQATSFLIAVPDGAGGNTLVPVHPESDSNLVARAKIDYKHNFSASTSFTNTMVVEAGSGNKFIQNDAGLAVKMTNSLALKVGYEIRHNSNVLAGFKKTDELLSTNLVYNFQ